MNANQHTIEQRLAEFTEVHGTVLLGMHRELQSQLKKVDERLASAGQALEAEAEGARKDLAERWQEVDAKYKEITRALQTAAAASQDREAGLRQAMEAHSDRIEDCVRKAEEVADAVGQSASELVEQARTESRDLVRCATDTIDRRQRDAAQAFEEAHAAFSCQIEAAEAKITAYMVKQQQLLDQQAQQIENLHASAQQVLAETNARIEAHQRREAEFNRRLRFAVATLIVIGLIVAVVGAWKPWTS